jgi:hypothetical protein
LDGGFDGGEAGEFCGVVVGWGDLLVGQAFGVCFGGVAGGGEELCVVGAVDGDVGAGAEVDCEAVLWGGGMGFEASESGWDGDAVGVAGFVFVRTLEGDAFWLLGEEGQGEEG